jgi:hypothetical protein
MIIWDEDEDRFVLDQHDGGFSHWSGQTKDYEIGIGCFSTKHVTLKSKSNGWLVGIFGYILARTS